MFSFRRRRHTNTTFSRKRSWRPSFEHLEARTLLTITPLPQTFQMFEGQTVVGTVAVFVDTDSVTPANFTSVSINWGDGTPATAGAVSQPGGAGTPFFVSGSHGYNEEGTAAVAVSMHDTLNNVTVNLTGNTANIVDSPLATSTTTPQSFAGTGGTGTAGGALTAMQNFEAAISGPNNGANPPPQPNGFRTINWDGIKLDGTDNGGVTTVINANNTVGIPVNRFQTRGVQFEQVYAVSGDGFADVNPSTAGLFPAFSPNNTFSPFNGHTIGMSFVLASPANTAAVPAGTRGFGAVFLNVELPNSTSIEYFNGTSSLGKYYVPAAPQGQPEFLGILFPSAQVTSVVLTLGTDVLFNFTGTGFSAGGTDSPATGHNLVATDDFVYAEPTQQPNAGATLAATEGTAFNGSVANFFDTNLTSAALSNYTATINWGDGHASNGTITANASGGFSVSGTNNYLEEGQYAVTTTVQDFGGASLTLTGTAFVGEAALTAAGTSLTVPQGVNATNALVATFTDAGGPEPSSSYTATINWGDGTTPTLGTVVLGSGTTFNVTGTHAFSAPGRYSISTTIQNESGTPVKATTSAVVGTQNERLVAAIYQTLLKRPVDPQGLAIWTDQLAMGATATQVALGIEGSAEYRGLEVQSLYNRYLHRQADPQGLNGGINFLASGGTLEQFSAILIGSPEFFINQGGNTISGFANALYLDALGRPIDASGEASIANAFGSGLTSKQIGALVLSSPEYDSNVVSAAYLTILGRKADPSGLNFGISQLQRGVTDEEYFASLIGSPEYVSKV